MKIKKDSNSNNSMGTDLMKIGVVGSILGAATGNNNTTSGFGNLMVAGMGLSMIEGMSKKGKKGKNKGLLSGWDI